MKIKRMKMSEFEKFLEEYYKKPRKQYYIKHREQLKEYTRRYYIKHREQLKEYTRRYLYARRHTTE